MEAGPAGRLGWWGLMELEMESCVYGRVGQAKNASPPSLSIHSFFSFLRASLSSSQNKLVFLPIVLRVVVANSDLRC